MSVGGYRGRSRRTDVVVVGAGLLGLSAAYELGRRGHDVVCLEQSTVGNERSGSKSESRLFRLSHDDPFYVRLASRSLEGWENLQTEAGSRLLEPATLLLCGQRMSRYVDAMAAAGVRARLASRAELSERFAGLNFDGPGAFSGEVLYDDTVQILLARKVLEALARLAQAELRLAEPALGIVESQDYVLVRTAAADYRCDYVVLCVGAWSGYLARTAGLNGSECLTPTLGQVAYLRPRSGALGATRPSWS